MRAGTETVVLMAELHSPFDPDQRSNSSYSSRARKRRSSFDKLRTNGKVVAQALRSCADRFRAVGIRSSLGRSRGCHTEPRAKDRQATERGEHQGPRTGEQESNRNIFLPARCQHVRAPGRGEPSRMSLCRSAAGQTRCDDRKKHDLVTERSSIGLRLHPWDIERLQSSDINISPINGRRGCLRFILPACRYAAVPPRPFQATARRFQ